MNGGTVERGRPCVEVDRAASREHAANGAARAGDMLNVDPTDAVRWAALDGARSGKFGAAEWSDPSSSSSSSDADADADTRTCSSAPAGTSV